jgi:glycosyltransferase involved in cell wall biosynthesis
MIQDVKHLANWTIVPNGVSLATYVFKSEVAPDAPLVFLGRIEEIKGPHLAIEIAKRSGRRLIIAGNVPEEKRSWFDRFVRPSIDGKKISYIGPVNDTQKNELLGVAGALLMPILWDEPFGIVMAEAMACGTPVLGTRRGAVPEVVVDGVTGAVRDDVDGLVAAVAQLATIDRIACRRRVEEMYSEDSIVEGYLEVYRRQVARRRNFS